MKTEVDMSLICPYKHCRLNPAFSQLKLQPFKISDHQQSWGYEDDPWKGPGPPLLVAADF